MELPYHEQETAYTCGPASMRMALEQLGMRKSEQELAKLLKTNKVRGTWLKHFPRAAEHFKLDYVVKRNASMADLRRLCKKDYVIIVCYLSGDIQGDHVDHYSVVRSIDMKDIHLLDPWGGPKQKYSLVYFKEIWRCDPKHEDDRRWFIAMRRASPTRPCLSRAQQRRSPGKPAGSRRGSKPSHLKPAARARA